MESTGTGHGNVGCYVTVFDIRRDLDDEIGQFRSGQGAIGHGGLGGIGQQGAGIGQRGLAGVVVFIVHRLPPVGVLLLYDLGQHHTIPALRLKHRSGGCGTAPALPKCSIIHKVLSALLA